MDRLDTRLAAVLVAALCARCSLALGWDRADAAGDAPGALALPDGADGHARDAPDDVDRDVDARDDAVTSDDARACGGDPECRTGAARRCCAGACRECCDDRDCPGARQACCGGACQPRCE